MVQLVVIMVACRRGHLDVAMMMVMMMMMIRPVNSRANFHEGDNMHVTC